VLENWARIKVEQEGRTPKDSLLDDVSRGIPPTDRAYKLQKRAAKAGFDWPDPIAGSADKVVEELREVRAAQGDAVEGELGDLLFSVINLCRAYKVDPSRALQRTNIKFTQRFQYVEQRMRAAGQDMTPENLAIMDSFWNEAKPASGPPAGLNGR
jgi:tetrapyrrole methylase family protein/MazG family protein